MHAYDVAVSYLVCCAVQVVSLRKQYMAEQDKLGYAEDVHYPQMLLLRPRY